MFMISFSKSKKKQFFMLCYVCYIRVNNYYYNESRFEKNRKHLYYYKQYKAVVFIVVCHFKLKLQFNTRCQ